MRSPPLSSQGRSRHKNLPSVLRRKPVSMLEADRNDYLSSHQCASGLVIQSVTTIGMSHDLRDRQLRRSMIKHVYLDMVLSEIWLCGDMV